MKKHVIFYTICLLFIQLLINCSVQVAGTGSGGEAKVIGIILDKENKPASNTLVELIPHDYNPLVDGKLDESLSDTTDTEGNFEFSVSAQGVYNIQALHLFQRTKLLIKGILVEEDTTIISTSTLTDPGALQLILPDTIDTINGYVYVGGTNFYKELTEAISISDSTVSILFDSLPSGRLPDVRFGRKDVGDSSVLIVDTVTIISNELVIINTVDPIVKPRWRFSCILGITQQTSDYFGGMDSVRGLVESQVALMLRLYNDPGLFNGIMEVSIDSVYVFSGVVADEVNSTYTGYDFRLIYHNATGAYAGSWVRATKTIYMAQNSDELFQDPQARNLAWAFGLFRGCWPLRWLNVDAENNPVNNQDYIHEPSIMHLSMVQTTWDPFSISIINYYADSTFKDYSIIHSIFPKELDVKVLTENGVPIPDAIVSMYGVANGTMTVDTPYVYSGITNTQGIFALYENVFNQDTIEEIEYGNYLVTAEHSGDTSYAWMPMSDVLNGWFINPDTIYTLTITF